jgi:hypothetical protein
MSTEQYPLSDVMLFIQCCRLQLVLLVPDMILSSGAGNYVPLSRPGRDVINWS